MAKYRCNTKTFIAPMRMEEGTVFTIHDDFIPGPHLDPLDEAAQAAMDKYFKDNPEASLHPIEQLPVTFAPENVETSQVEPTGEVELGLAGAAVTKAQPGLTDGGKV